MPISMFDAVGTGRYGARAHQKQSGTVDHMNIWKLLAGACLFGVGVLAGGYLFAGSQPRSFLALADCGKTCYKKKDLAGLLASVGINRADSVVPLVVRETDRCIAIYHPRPLARLHYVFFPKKDIKNIADIAIDDQPYVLDCLALIRAVISDKGLRGDYRVYTNGPDLQDVTYLHFHLVSGGHGSLLDGEAARLSPDAAAHQPPGGGIR
jgi:diadenosine tetraphosphate (Ap4A) HIT family hydrolase